MADVCRLHALHAIWHCLSASIAVGEHVQPATVVLLCYTASAFSVLCLRAQA